MKGKKRNSYTGITKSQRYVPYLFLSPTMVLFAAVFIIPIIFVVCTGFTNWNMLDPSKGIKFVGLRNYINLLKDPNVWNSLKVTFLFTIIVVPLNIAMGIALALTVDSMKRGKKLVETILLIPMMVASVSVMLTFRFMFEPTYGIINKLLAVVGISGPGWFASTKTALLTVVIVELWKQVPFAYLMMYASLQTLPTEPFEAARVDGGSSWQIFRYITVPSLKPSIYVLLIVRIMDTIRTFDNIYVLTKGGPGNSTKTIQYICYELSFQSFYVGKGSALAMIIVIIILITGIGLISAMNKINREL